MAKSKLGTLHVGDGPFLLEAFETIVDYGMRHGKSAKVIAQELRAFMVVRSPGGIP